MKSLQQLDRKGTTKAETSPKDVLGKLWKVIGVIVISIVAVVYSSACAIVEYGLFKGGSPSYTTIDANEACMKSLIESDFDLIEWDRYEQWFDENTMLELPEVGIYKGPLGIREYVQVTVSKYFEGDSRYIYGPTILLLQDSDKKKCQMLATFGLKSNMNPNYTRGGLLERGVGAKIQYSADPFKVSKVYI